MAPCKDRIKHNPCERSNLQLGYRESESEDLPISHLISPSFPVQ